jgi:hypothetical protein
MTVPSEMVGAAAPVLRAFLAIQSRAARVLSFFQRQIEECRELLRHAVNAEDRAFWQHAAERWEGMLEQMKETAPRKKSGDAAKQQRVA